MLVDLLYYGLQTSQFPLVFAAENLVKYGL